MRKQDVITLDDVITYYDQVKLIRFHEDVIIEDVQAIFENSINVDKDHNFATYYTKGGYHCEDGKYRSLDDLFKLAKYYFPGILLGEIIRELFIYEEDLGEEDHTLSYGYCPDIRKCNFMTWYMGYDGFKSEIVSDYRGNDDNLKFLKLGFTNCHIGIYELLD